MAKPFRAVASYVSTRQSGVSHEVRVRVDLNAAAPATLDDVYCTCAGWRFSRTTPRTCNHVRRYVEVDQFDQTSPNAPRSYVRQYLAADGILAAFTERQLDALERVLEPRLVRRAAGTPPPVAPGSARTVLARQGLRRIVFDE